MIAYRFLNKEELERVAEIDVTENGEKVYKVMERKLVLVMEPWHRSPRNKERWRSNVREWQDMLERGGAAIGAFSESHLVGLAVLHLHLTERQAQLAALFVSNDMRRQGIATRLIAAVVELALANEAHELYVSATPSESAVGCYLSQGFTLAEQVNVALFAREPEDIHLVKAL